MSLCLPASNPLYASIAGPMAFLKPTAASISPLATLAVSASVPARRCGSHIPASPIRA